MKNNIVLPVALLMILLSSCEAIGGIFKAGMGFGIFIVLFVIILIAVLLFRRKK